MLTIGTFRTDAQGVRLDGDAPPGAVALPAGVSAALLAALVVWLGLFLTGVLPWVGAVSTVRHSTGTIAPAASFGPMGFKRFPMLKGQTFILKHQVDVEGGADMDVVIYRYGARADDPLPLTRVATWQWTSDGSGVFEVPITQSGLYSVQINDVQIKAGARVAYSLRWGVRLFGGGSAPASSPPTSNAPAAAAAPAKPTTEQGLRPRI